MADNDKDRATLAASQGTGPGLSKPASPTRPQASAGTGTGSTGTSASDRSGSTTDVSGKSKQMADEAKHYAGEIAGRAKEQGRSMFEERKHSTASQVDSVAHAFRNAAGQLQREEQSQAGRYVNMAADRLESFGQQLRHKDMDTLLADVESLGRRAPGTFFAGSVVAGFLFARFLKSSAERRHGQAAREVQRSRSTYDDEMSRFPADVHDPVSGGMGSASATGVSDSTIVGGPPVGSTIASGDGTGGSIGPGTQPSSSNGSKPGGNTYGNR